MDEADQVCGMFLVGRKDGAIEPFFVQVADDGISCHESLVVLMVHAQRHKGWWWRRMEVPSSVPTSFVDVPDLPFLRGGL